MNRFDFAFTPSRGPARNECTRQGEEAVRILRDGGYEAPSGAKVDVAAAVRSATVRTVDHPPHEAIALPEPRPGSPTRITVVNGTSLASARAFAARGKTALVLNFASAKNPGGGFLRGARAQEESLARASGLYACIEGKPMYSHHRASGDPLYTSWMLWSPDVPVLRDDATEQLLEEPYLAAFLTAAAPNAKEVLARDPGRASEVERAMAERITRSLAIAALHGHRELVLGAWGCGVFANDPSFVATTYHEELTTRFAGVFDEIVFAVLDWSDERRFVRPFVERFA
jgi:uncharacterized protein (TIGR02452 family)